LFRSLLFSTLFLLLNSLCHAQLERFEFTQPKMGAPFTIIFYASDSVKAGRIARQSFQLVDSLVNIFSDYIDSSELNRLCASAGSKNPFQLSPTLFDILWQSKLAYEKSEGCFDITLGPITRLWRSARKKQIFPEDAAVKEKLAMTGFKKIRWDTARRQVILLHPGMQLDLGGIAQGYIAQKTIDNLQANKINNALVDVSGDIVCIGAPPGTKGWTVGINVPESKNHLLKQQLLITNNAVTTSGDVYQYMEHNGKRYSHIVDPKTGYGITAQRNVTAIAGDGTTADWLTKACSLLPINKSKKLAAKLKAAFLITEIRNGTIYYHETSGFRKFWKVKK
jgi:FAD:protein FMN transferase